MAEHGKFYWNEFMAKAAAKAKAFYTSVMGWTADEMPGPGDSIYTVFKKDDQPVGGMMAIKDSAAPPDTPSHWYSYISVDDVDACAAAVTEAGGQVLAGPFDVDGIGRIATILDADGGPVGIMTPASG